MRILMVNKFLFYNGGSETYTFQLGEALEALGNQVQYFGMEHPDRIVGNHAESYTSAMDFHTGKINKILYPLRIIYSVEARKKIKKVLEDFRPEVVHLNNFNFQITPSVIYEIRKWGKKNHCYIPIVYTAHDYQWVCPNHMLFIPGEKKICFQCRNGKFCNCVRNRCIHNSRLRSLLGMLEAELYKRLKTYRKVDRIICPSKFMKDKLETDPVLTGRLQVMHNFLKKKPSVVLEKKDYVVYFGRFTGEKGVETLLEACRQLPDIPFKFAGGGELEDKISEVPNVENVGFQTGEKLEKLIAEARFSVFPSQWYENCPFSVMESQLYGTPVLAADIGGVPELLEDGITGELFMPGDVCELKEKIEKLWSDRERLSSYTENCRKKTFCTDTEYGNKMMRIYRELQKEMSKEQ